MQIYFSNPNLSCQYIHEFAQLVVVSKIRSRIHERNNVFTIRPFVIFELLFGYFKGIIVDFSHGIILSAREVFRQT